MKCVFYILIKVLAIMLYTEDFTMRHYVGLSQIGSHITVGWHTKILKNNIGIIALGDGLGINLEW